MLNPPTGSSDEVAIIGLAGRFPGANSVDALWENLTAKVDSITHFTKSECISSGVPTDLVNHPDYVRSKGYLEDADLFDAEFFKFSQHDAEILDPQYRLAFEVTWEALENSGYVPEDYPGKIGLFLGSSNINTYFQHNLVQPGCSFFSDNFTVALHNAKDFIPSLLAYKLNLQGPSVAVQTGCSTSLVSVCMACQSILHGEADMAIAGGSCVSMPLKSGHLFQDGMMLSPTGICRSFDNKANGIVLGNGVGVVVLKRLDRALKDRDTIHALIKGFNVNNDGSSRIGFTAPGPLGQQAVVQSALDNAGVKAEQISYIETHGTGTILGDLVEIEALNNVFSKCKQPIAIGSIKPNIGHLDAAAGIANLIKVTQALKHRTLAPNIHFDSPSKQLKLDETPFYLNTKTQSWVSDTPLYAGTSSFGMGGTNAHVILAEAPARCARTCSGDPVMLILSARSENALKAMTENLVKYLKNNPELNLNDVAYTLQVGRKSFAHRAVFCVTSLTEAIEKLSRHEVSDVSQEPFLSWINGNDVNWEKLDANQGCYRIPLPTYCFEPKRYWTTKDQLQLPKYKSVAHNDINQSNKIAMGHVLPTVKKIYEDFLVQSDIDTHLDFESLGGDSLVSILITHEINKALQVKVPFSIVENNLSVNELSKHIVSHIENTTVERS